MSINQLIAGGIQLPRFESPMNMMAQLSQLESAREANELRRMQMAQMQRQQEQEMGLRNMLQSDQPLSVSRAAMFGPQGLRAFELQQGELEARRKAQESEDAKSEKQRMAVAKSLYTSFTNPTNENFERTFQFLKEQGLTKGLEPVFSEMMLQAPNERAQMIQSFVNATPGMASYFQELDKGRADIEAKRAEALFKGAQTSKVGMEMAGTLPRGEGQRLAPSVQVILDEEGKPIVVDITKFAGTARLGAPGVIGRPADMRRPAPTTASIQDPSNPSRQLIIDTREYTGGTVGSPGVIGVAGAQAGVSREESKKEIGRQTLGSILDQYESLYDSLQATGSITSTERGAIPNIGAYLATTPPGQIAGQAVGSRAQSVRDQIKAMRTDLARQIMQATGMSAKNLDSNRELQLMLDSLADPATGYEAATAIINRLRQSYLGGGALPSRGSVGAETPASAGRQNALPMPARKEDAVAGQVYQTSRGPARWDGKQFIPVSE